MKTHRTIRFRLYPGTREKHQLLHGTAGACRFVWNHYRNCRQIALSDGKMYDLPDLKEKEKRRKFYQRKIARCVKGSNRRKKVKLKLQSAYQAERFVRLNWCHHVSKIIAAKYNLVFMEDLNTQGMTASAKGTVDEPGKHVKQKSGLNREILKTGWYILERCLNYKSKVVKVDPKFISQTCSVCGHVDKSNRKSQSEFKCVCCRYPENANINAALNIWAVGNTVTGRGLELPTEFQALERQ